MKMIFLLITIIASTCFIFHLFYFRNSRSDRDFLISNHNKSVMLSRQRLSLPVVSGGGDARSILAKFAATSSLVSISTSTPTFVPTPAQNVLSSTTLYKVDPGFGGGIPAKPEDFKVSGDGLTYCDQL